MALKIMSCDASSDAFVTSLRALENLCGVKLLGVT